MTPQDDFYDEINADELAEMHDWDAHLKPERFVQPVQLNMHSELNPDELAERFYSAGNGWLELDTAALFRQSPHLLTFAAGYKGLVPIWLTSDGKAIPLPLMHFSHLRNCWLYVNRHLAEQYHYHIHQQPVDRAVFVFWCNSLIWIRKEWQRRKGAAPQIEPSYWRLATQLKLENHRHLEQGDQWFDNDDLNIVFVHLPEYVNGEDHA